MKRLLVVLGVLALLGGLALVAVGVLVATAVRPDGTVSSAPAHLRSSGVAVVAGDLAVDAGFVPVPTSLGTVTLGITARDGRSLFVGAAAPSAVTRYLEGAPYDVVTVLTAGADATTVSVPGTRLPRPPATSSIWRVKASGRSVSFTSLPSGALVVMHDDASQGVDADLVVTLHAPGLRTYAWAAAGAGVLLLLLAVLLLVGARRRGRAPQPETSPVPPPVVLPVAVPGPAADAFDDDAPVPAVPAGSVAVDSSAGEADVPSVAASPVEVAPASVAEPGDAPDTSIPADNELTVEPADDEVTVEPAGERAAAVPEEQEPDPVYDALVAAYGGDPVRDSSVEVPGSDGDAGRSSGG